MAETALPKTTGSWVNFAVATALGIGLLSLTIYFAAKAARAGWKPAS